MRGERGKRGRGRELVVDSEGREGEGEGASRG